MPFFIAGIHFPLFLISETTSSLNPPVGGPLIASEFILITEGNIYDVNALD